MVAVLSLFFWFVASAFPATSTATQSITVTIPEIAEITVSGNPGPFIINHAPESFSPTTVTKGTTVMSWTSNVNSRGAGTRKITAQLDMDYANGIELKAGIGDPSCGTGSPTGMNHLGTIAREVYAGIGNENCAGAAVNFEASLNRMTDPVSETRILTWTLTEDQ